MTGIAQWLNEQGFTAELSLAIESAILFILGFIVLYVVGRAVVISLTRRLLDRRDFDEHARRPIMRITSVFVVFVALTLAFGIAGLESFLFAFAGIAAAGALAVGFALQNVIRNFIAGIFIYLEKPFRLDDWIEWEDHVGTVEDIRLRTTRVRSFDNELMTVPNSQLTESVVTNPVEGDRLRQRVTVGIGFDDDIGLASELMLEEAHNHPEILDDPAPSVRLTELGDSAVSLQSRVWIAEPKRADFVRIRGEYTQHVKERFDAEDIDIPFPIRTLDGAVELEGSLH